MEGSSTAAAALRPKANCELTPETPPSPSSSEQEQEQEEEGEGDEEGFSEEVLVAETQCDDFDEADDASGEIDQGGVHAADVGDLVAETQCDGGGDGFDATAANNKRGEFTGPMVMTCIPESPAKPPPLVTRYDPDDETQEEGVPQPESPPDDDGGEPPHSRQEPTAAALSPASDRHMLPAAEFPLAASPEDSCWRGCSSLKLFDSHDFAANGGVRALSLFQTASNSSLAVGTGEALPPANAVLPLLVVCHLSRVSVWAARQGGLARVAMSDSELLGPPTAATAAAAAAATSTAAASGANNFTAIFDEWVPGFDMADDEGQSGVRIKLDDITVIGEHRLAAVDDEVSPRAAEEGGSGPGPVMSRLIMSVIGRRRRATAAAPSPSSGGDHGSSSSSSEEEWENVLMVLSAARDDVQIELELAGDQLAPPSLLVTPNSDGGARTFMTPVPPIHAADDETAGGALACGVPSAPSGRTLVWAAQGYRCPFVLKLSPGDEGETAAGKWELTDEPSPLAPPPCATRGDDGVATVVDLAAVHGQPDRVLGAYSGRAAGEDVVVMWSAETRALLAAFPISATHICCLRPSPSADILAAEDGDSALPFDPEDACGDLGSSQRSLLGNVTFVASNASPSGGDDATVAEEESDGDDCGGAEDAPLTLCHVVRPADELHAPVNVDLQQIDLDDERPEGKAAASCRDADVLVCESQPEGTVMSLDPAAPISVVASAASDSLVVCVRRGMVSPEREEYESPVVFDDGMHVAADEVALWDASSGTWVDKALLTVDGRPPLADGYSYGCECGDAATAADDDDGGAASRRTVAMHSHFPFLACSSDDRLLVFSVANPQQSLH